MVIRYESERLMDDERDLLKSAAFILDGESCIVKNLISIDSEPYILRISFGEGDQFDSSVPYEERELEIEASILLERGKGIYQQHFKLVDGMITDFYARHITFPVEPGDLKCEVSYDYLGEVSNGEMGMQHAVVHLGELLEDFAREAGLPVPLRGAMKRINRIPGEIGRG